METLYENHRKTIKVKFLLWFFLLVFIGASIGGWVIFQTFGLSPADGGVLRPFWERLAFGLFVAGLGLACAGGMMLYATLYVVYCGRNGDQVVIDTLTMWGAGTKRHEFHVSQIGKGTYHHGQLDLNSNTYGVDAIVVPSVDAPWVTMPVAGRFIPFIFDMKAETIEVAALTRLSEGTAED